MRCGWAEALSRIGQFYSATIGQFYPGVDTTSGVNFILEHQLQIQDIMNPEAVLAALPDSKENALTLEDIALAMDLDTSSYTATGRTKRQLSRTLRSLIKWGWVDCDVRQNENGNKAWHNAYWKTELAKSV